MEHTGKGNVAQMGPLRLKVVKMLSKPSGRHDAEFLWGFCLCMISLFSNAKWSQKMINSQLVS